MEFRVNALHFIQPHLDPWQHVALYLVQTKGPCTFLQTPVPIGAKTSSWSCIGAWQSDTRTSLRPLCAPLFFVTSLVIVPAKYISPANAAPGDRHPRLSLRSTIITASARARRSSGNHGLAAIPTGFSFPPHNPTLLHSYAAQLVVHRAQAKCSATSPRGGHHPAHSR